ATNHDMCYARSKDGGQTWENSKGEIYKLPITIKTAEVALQIPQNSELINQTSMTADEGGNPIIATYLKGKAASGPQYQIIYNDDKEWHSMPASSRESTFSLSGGGTKKIPISRPQILHQKKGDKEQVILLFRDLERDSKPSAAINNDFPSATWQTVD